MADSKTLRPIIGGYGMIPLIPKLVNKRHDYYCLSSTLEPTIVQQRDSPYSPQTDRKNITSPIIAMVEQVELRHVLQVPVRRGILAAIGIGMVLVAYWIV
jgi:hypothetical protein